MQVTWERAGENNKVAGQACSGSGAPRKKTQGMLPTCERPPRSSSPFVPAKDLLAGLVTSGDHQWRKAHALRKGEKRGSDQGETSRLWALTVVWKLFKKVRRWRKRQIQTATVTTIQCTLSQRFNVFWHRCIKEIWRNLQKPFKAKNIHFSDFPFFLLTGSVLIKSKE